MTVHLSMRVCALIFDKDLFSPTAKNVLLVHNTQTDMRMLPAESLHERESDGEALQRLLSQHHLLNLREKGGQVGNRLISFRRTTVSMTHLFICTIEGTPLCTNKSFNVEWVDAKFLLNNCQPPQSAVSRLFHFAATLAAPHILQTDEVSKLPQCCNALFLKDGIMRSPDIVQCPGLTHLIQHNNEGMYTVWDIPPISQSGNETIH